MTRHTALIFGISFITAFVVNVLWEEFHHILYVHYKGGFITHAILLRAALFDACVVTLLVAPAVLLKKRRYWYGAALGAFIFAVGLERFALTTGRWLYSEAMPIVPILGSGLTPTVQLAFTVCIVWIAIQWYESSYTMKS